MISDLKDEVAVLWGKHCHCGEPEQIASSEAGELEYVNHEVNPLPLIILTETDEVIEVLASPETLPIQVEKPVRGQQRAIQGRGTKENPYLLGFHPIWCTASFSWHTQFCIFHARF